MVGARIEPTNIIDTLFLSPLLFPTKPYHALLKDDKLQTEESNNPVNDSIKARDLFYDEINAFQTLDDGLKRIFYLLLHDKIEFRAFFRFIKYENVSGQLENEIRIKFNSIICEHAELSAIIAQHPIELAYSLALLM